MLWGIFIAVCWFVTGATTMFILATTDNPVSRLVQKKAANRRWTYSKDAEHTVDGSAGRLYITLWLPEGDQSVETKVKLLWGGLKGTVTVPVTADGVVLWCNKWDAGEATVRVKTSVQVRQMVTLTDECPELPHEEIKEWKER